MGGEIFPLSFTRPDCLYVGGIHARAMDFATEDLYKTALYFLVYLGQTHKEGITYTREGIGAREYVHWSDSDWAKGAAVYHGRHRATGHGVAHCHEPQARLHHGAEHSC